MASEATGMAGLAARYAAALYALADERKALDSVAGDLKSLRGLIDDSPDFRRVIRSPVLERNRRLFALPTMISGYLAILAARRGEVTAEIVAAQELSPAQRKAIDARLRKAVGGKVAIDIRVDPSLLGGLVVKVGSRMVDASLKNKLARLELAMKGAG